MRPETVLRWHRDLLARRHAAKSHPSGPAVHEPSARSGSWCCAVLWRDEKLVEIAGYDKPGDARQIDDRGRVVVQVGPYFRSDRVYVVAQRLHRRPPRVHRE